MSIKSKLYVGGVITAGALVLGPSLLQWNLEDPAGFLIYLFLALLASMLKVKLPGLSGTFSLNFLFILIGILHFGLPETLVVGCSGALMQTFWNTGRRPALVQVLFNLGNVSFSTGLCFGLAHGLLANAWGVSGAIGMSLVACLFFVVNTGLVSAVLSLLQGKSLREVSREWYLWSFPYYLVGAVLVSLLPLSGQAFRPEAWLLLLPPLYLVHFYYGLSLQRHPDNRQEETADRRRFSPAAKLYLGMVITTGLSLLAWGMFHWESEYGMRFVFYLLVVALASTLKVRLPGMTGTISVNFVVLLAGIAVLSLPELMLLAAVAAVAQCFWRPKRFPSPVQLLFNVATMVLGTSLGYLVCRLWLPSAVADSLPSLLVVATAFLYVSNTLLVSFAWCLAERRPLQDIWQRCCFWSLPYYLVGAGFAAVMVLASGSIGWQQSFLALPLMLLVYVSYRIHVDQASQLAVASVKMD